MTPLNVGRKRRWPWIAGGVVLFVLLLGLILPLFINVDHWRPEIEAAISASTGREVKLGTLHARLLPTAAVVVDGLQIGNPKDFASGNLVSVESVHAGVSLMPLLGGHIHMTSVTLVRPQLNLVEDENGRVNYTFPKETKGSNAAKSGGDSGSGFSLDSIGSIALDRAEVTLEQIASRGAKPFTTIAAHKVNVSLENVILDANAVKQWSGEANLSGVSVELGALAAPVTFDSGTVKLGGGLLHVEFRAHAGKVGEVKGTLNVPDVTNAVTTFEVSTKELDADALLAAIRSTPETRPSAHPAALTSELLAQGKFTAERVAWAPYLGGNANAEIRIYGDRMEVMPASMALYGGTLQFTARTDARQTPERFSANLKLSGLDLGRMLAVTNGGMKGKMTGFMEMDLQMFGSTGGVWQKSLTGNGKFSVRDGKLPGISLVGALGMLAKAAGVNETSFSLIAGDLGIGDARVTTRETKMDSSSGTVVVSGGFSLMDQSINFDGKATLAPSGPGGVPTELLTGLLGSVTNRQITSITVPFSLRGTLSDPKFLPGKGIPSFGGSASNDQPGKKVNPQDVLGKILGGKHK